MRDTHERFLSEAFCAEFRKDLERLVSQREHPVRVEVDETGEIRGCITLDGVEYVDKEPLVDMPRVDADLLMLAHTLGIESTDENIGVLRFRMACVRAVARELEVSAPPRRPIKVGEEMLVYGCISLKNEYPDMDAMTINALGDGFDLEISVSRDEHGETWISFGDVSYRVGASLYSEAP
jgi:hypothetical protein